VFGAGSSEAGMGVRVNTLKTVTSACALDYINSWNFNLFVLKNH
jgi:hypothetical protein